MRAQLITEFEALQFDGTKESFDAIANHNLFTKAAWFKDDLTEARVEYILVYNFDEVLKLMINDWIIVGQFDLFSTKIVSLTDENFQKFFVPIDPPVDPEGP